MLNTLTVWNFALIEHVQIDFDKGLNILTGETGAGKSILIDALGAMLGNRLSTELIRNGCEWLRIEAVFSIDTQDKVTEFLQENAIDISDGELIITRQITSAGRGTILVNGCHTTVGILKKLGSLLVDIHGQNENLNLLSADSQFALVDGSDDRIKCALEEYRSCFAKVKDIRGRLKEKQDSSRDFEQRQEMLRWQLQEIENAQLQEGEDEDLEREINKLSNAEKISNYAGSACQQLYGGGKEGLGAISSLEVAIESLSDLSRYDDAMDNISNVLREACLQIKEAGYEVRAYADNVEYNPQLLDRLQGRMDTIDKLRRKYGATIADILAFYEKAQKELLEIDSFDDDIAALQKDLDLAEKDAMEQANRLSILRQQASERLQIAIEEHLKALSMPDARLEIMVSETDQLNSMGNNEIEVMFSANPGQELKPIQKVASGGELSRIALAIKAVTAFRDESPSSMVFDEIDTGIGGKTAQMVAERIAMVAAGKQVLCITHLPQIACMADNHLYISKHVAEGTTATSIRVLTDGERVNEIARMASGADVTAASLDNAREMLAGAVARKRQYIH